MAFEGIDGGGTRGVGAWGSPIPGPRLPPIIGRSGEAASLRGLLLAHDAPLVTIVGPAGCGKTRLALAVAQELAPAFGDRVAFVDLSALSDAEGVLAQIACSLGVAEAAPDLCATIAGSVGERPFLLVLDSAEHVLPAAGDIAALLRTAPALTLLVTSRTPLGLYGEHEFPLEPLPVPAAWGDGAGTEAGEGGALLRLGDCPSVALFTRTARMVWPDFGLTEANAAAVAEICVRLDGLPLAIELAAARMKLLTPETLLRRLAEPAGSPLRDLASAAANRPERHRTLERAIDSSYALLSPEEQRLFRAVSIFAGSFDLDAAAAVVPNGGVDVLDGLSVLVNHSLIRRSDERDAGSPRFSMLTTIREFAAEQLASAREVDAVRAAHARHMLALAEAVDARAATPADLERRARLERDWDNLRAALHWSTAEGNDPELGLDLAGALIWFWKHNGRQREGSDWLRLALARAPNAAARLRARALLALGTLDLSLDALPAALTSLEAAVSLARPGEDERLLASSLSKLACAVCVAGDAERERALYEEALDRFHACGDSVGAAVALNGLGEAARTAGDFAAARRYYEASLAGLSDTAPSQLAVVQHNLGYVEEHDGAIETMAARFQRALALAIELNDQAMRALCLAGLGAAARAAGDLERAARLFGAFEAARERNAVRIDSADREAHERNMALASATLGEAEYQRLLDEGRGLSPEQTLAEARAVDGRPPSVAGTRRTAAPRALSRREVEVALLVARGLTNRQIAAELTISERTAGTHIEHIMTKLGIHSRAQIAGWVAEQRPRPLPDPLRVA